jgi:urease accessory protein
MNDAPTDKPQIKAPVHGVARVGFVRDGTITRLGPLYQQPPLRVLFPRPAAGDSLQAVLLNASGGVVGGDRLEVGVRAGEGTRALVTSQAAEKVYRSAGPEARLDVHLSIGDGAWLEWWPQETILFDQARLRRRLVIDAAPGARALIGELLVFGRQAHGEQLRAGLLHESWAVRADGRLLWADALRLDGDIAARLAAPFGFAGARAAATLIYLGADAQSWLAPARELIPADGVRAGVSCLPGLLVSRWLDPDAARLRQSYAGFIARFRALVAGLPDRLPTIWSI